MTHIKMIAKTVAEQTGAEYQTAYTAARMALEAIPTPAPGVRWDFYRIPDDLVDQVTAGAIEGIKTLGGKDNNPLHDVQVAQNDFTAAEEELEKARATRDDAIRTARRAGAPIAALQKLTGLSRQRVSAICAM